MITLRSLTDIDFVAGCAAALLGTLLVLVPALAPLAARLAPEVLFGFASGAMIRWALRQPTSLPPAPPAAIGNFGSPLFPRTLVEELEPKGSP